MPDFTNIVTVDLTEATGYNVEAHRAVHQWDSGVILQLTGATFPQGTTCQFDTKTTTFNQELTDGACEIPNALLGYDMIGDIKAHVKIDDDDYGIVVYDIHIPVIRRPKPDSYIYTDNSSSSNGWVKSRYGYRVNEDQTILGRTELSINDNQTILNGTSLSLNNQQTVLDGTHLSLASGLFYADATHLQLNSGRITIGPNKLLVDSRVFGTVNLINMSRLEQGTLVDGDGTEYPTTTRLRSGYTSVNASTTYTISMTSGVTFIYVFFYNASKDFISKSAYIDTAQSTFTTPSGCAYVRVNMHYTNDATILPSAVSNLQLEEGSVVSPFVPHALDVVELTNRDAVQEWRSRNIWDPNITFAQGAFGEGSPSQDRIYNMIFQQVKPGTTYTLSFKFNVENVVHGYFVWFNRNKGYISSSVASLSSSPYTFQVPSDIYFFTTIFVRSGGNLAPSNLVSIQLEEGLNGSVFSDYALDNMELTNRRFVQDWESKNLIDQASIEQGEIDASSGGTYALTTRLRSGYCSVKANTNYTLSFLPNTITVIRIFCYNSAVAYTGAIYKATTSGCTFTTPSDCAYVRFNFFKGAGSETIVPSDITYPQLEEGLSPTTYVPYALDNIDLTKRTKDLINISRSFTITANASTSGGWFVIIEKWLPQTSAWQALISIRATMYEYTPGPPRTFLVESYYGDIRISPLSCTEDAYDNWIDLLRITRNDNSMFVEGRVIAGISSPTINHFSITVTDLSGQYGKQYVVPSEFKWTSATTEIRTYDLNKKVNRLLNKGDMYFKRGDGTYTYNIVSQHLMYFTLQIFGFVGDIGAVNLTMTCNGGTIYVYDNMTNNSFVSDYLSFAYDYNTGVLSIWSYAGYHLFILGL